MAISKYWAIAVVAALAMVVGGCVKQPTSKQNVIDDRPAIAFKSQTRRSLNTSYQVYIDNLFVGSAADYQSGKTALRILSGTHLITVKRKGETVFEQTVYLGDGAEKEILIP